MQDTHGREAIQEGEISLIHRWQRLPIGRQLLISVNSILLLVASAFLLLDYQVRFRRQLQHKRIALSEEAKTMYESLLAVADSSLDLTISDVLVQHSTTRRLWLPRYWVNWLKMRAR